ncbi:MAG: hypothetical protein ABJF01_06550 [bacterium]
MRQILAACRAACWLFIVVALARVTNAQTWNDPRSLSLVDRATTRRVQQLTDTGLKEYKATAHGYVTFLAQLGEGFLTPPKIIKADELELEVYWHAPNQSKQRIVGRRDTLLLPTDIAYHRDHLGIVQNNFPLTIRIGDGDEVRDVPHPLSALGMQDYDFALSDSFAIGSGSQRIRVYEVKVRPKDDRQPRVVGAIYLDASGAQVVRMNLSFTRAAFLDKALEQLSVVLENRLVAGRLWLPSRQEIEIRRTGEWLDYPVRGIIRGRWEIGGYQFDIGLPQAIFAGPEIVQAPAAELKQFAWKGAILDSLPPDVRAVTDADVARVQAEAHALVRRQALARAERVSISARNVSDLARFDRVEGFALGAGLSKQLGLGWSATARGRYGLDDHAGKGSGHLAWQQPGGFGLRFFGGRDFRDTGDEMERSGAVNSIAAQEFGNDDTDPYLVQGAGIGLDFPTAFGAHWTLDGAIERQDSLSTHARPVVGDFQGTIASPTRRLFRLSLSAVRPPSLWWLGTELGVRSEMRAGWDLQSTTGTAGSVSALRTLRASATADLERPVSRYRFVSRTTGAGLWSSAFDPEQELIYFGGPVSAPGYDYHSIVARAAVSEHLEWQFPVPFPAFSLGRFGRVPSSATLAPFVHGVLVSTPDCDSQRVVTFPAGGVEPPLFPSRACAFSAASSSAYPSIGAGFLLPFDLVRIDVARGLRRGFARWTFSIDVSREFWSIL